MSYSHSLLYNHSCISVFGRTRSDGLRKTGLIGSFVGSNRLLLVELGLLGPFARLDEPLILHRGHLSRSTRSIPNPTDRAAWFDASLSKTRVYPHWRLMKEYSAALSASGLTFRERLKCRIHLLRWIRWRGWKSLLSGLRERERGCASPKRKKKLEPSPGMTPIHANRSL